MLMLWKTFCQSPTFRTAFYVKYLQNKICVHDFTHDFAHDLNLYMQC